MQKLLNFFFKNRHPILFLVLLFVSLFLTIQTHDYHKSRFFYSTGQITGAVHEVFSEFGDYLDLKTQNSLLLDENNRLKSLEFNGENTLNTPRITENKYALKTAKVVKNSYKWPENYLILNKGREDGIEEDHGVVTSNGIVGIVDKTSRKYARVVSILNTKIKINAKLKKSNHFGTLEWNAQDPNIVQLLDIQDLVKLTQGDTIVTSGYSMIFPENIPIGTIDSYRLNQTKDLYIIDVKLFNDMSNLKLVHVIENLDLEELETLNSEHE